jgi:hypothetical protein
MKELGRLNVIFLLPLFAPHFPFPINSNATRSHNLTHSQHSRGVGRDAKAAAAAAMQTRQADEALSKI